MISYLINNVRVYFREEKGNLFVKDKDGDSKPIKYELFISEEPLTLWDYKNIMGLSLLDAVIELDKSNTVLLTNKFNLAFYTREDVDSFMKVTKHMIRD